MAKRCCNSNFNLRLKIKLTDIAKYHLVFNKISKPKRDHCVSVSLVLRHPKFLHFLQQMHSKFKKRDYVANETRSGVLCPMMIEFLKFSIWLNPSGIIVKIAGGLRNCRFEKRVEKFKWKLNQAFHQCIICAVVFIVAVYV